jgi:CHCH domain
LLDLQKKIFCQLTGYIKLIDCQLITYNWIIDWKAFTNANKKLSKPSKLTARHFLTTEKMDKFELSRQLANHHEKSISSTEDSSKDTAATEGAPRDSTDDSMEDNTKYSTADNSIVKDNTTQDNSNPDKMQEAFDEETGEINWDCPCLGEMVKEPCGEKFKEAFSCFVYSKEEVKGSDCVEQFRAMQSCFQQHPEIYGQELASGSSDNGDNSTDELANIQDKGDVQDQDSNEEDERED